MQLRDALLYALESHRGEDLSGQALAAWLGVSRNAVWKAIESLRSDGYDIRSAPRRGYRLADSTDRISAAGLRAALGERGCSCEVFCYDVIDSTNSEAKRLLAAGLSGDALLAAVQQTGGRGRRGRSFYSPAETGVYFSLVLHPKGDASDLISLTAAAAVAVVRATERYSDAAPKIKWVNDVYLGDRKIAGILTEAVTGLESGTVESVVVGIGLNLSTSGFPEELKETAGALGALRCTKNQFIAEIVSELSVFAAAPAEKSYLADYRRCSLVLGRRVRFFRGDSAFDALATGIDDHGGLMVTFDDGTSEVLRSGEITLRLQDASS